ncbi:MAG: alpha/beta fold hydrolase [Deinococcus sp.]|nr:alpha/beta fold hydrolase [Deinococcus sp.]
MKRQLASIGLLVLIGIGLVVQGQEAAPLVTETLLQISAGDHQIPAVWATPAGVEGQVPALLLIHGFASHKDEVGNFYKRLAASLAERGFASLRFDFPGSGDSTVSFTANTVAGQVADARQAFEFLLSQPTVDTSRAGVVGFSLGGIVGSALAGTDPRVKALVLWSTPGDTAAAFANLYDQYYQAAVEYGSVVADLGFRQVELSQAFFESLFASFPLSDIRNFTGPLLIIAGENDGPQPRYAREFARNAGSFDVTLRILPGADHIYQVLTPDQTNAEQVIAITTNWITEKL